MHFECNSSYYCICSLYDALDSRRRAAVRDALRGPPAPNAAARASRAVAGGPRDAVLGVAAARHLARRLGLRKRRSPLRATPLLEDAPAGWRASGSPPQAKNAPLPVRIRRSQPAERASRRNYHVPRATRPRHTAGASALCLPSKSSAKLLSGLGAQVPPPQKILNYNRIFRLSPSVQT